MARLGKVSGDVKGKLNFLDQCNFTQGITGAGVQVVKDSAIWYVDKYKTGPAASGNGTSWKEAFLTITEAVAEAGAYDTIFIGAGTYSEKVTVTQYGLKMFGALASTGLQSFTTISAVLASAAPCLTITTKGKQEIAGINFNQLGAKAAIQLGESGGSGLYSIHIHHCRLDGNAVGTYGISNYAASNPEDCPDLVVDNCKFNSFVTAAVYANSTRDSYINNYIFVPVDTVGIQYVPTTTTRPYGIIDSNRFCGIANASTTAIAMTGTPAAGGLMIIDNKLSGTWDVTIEAETTAAGCENYEGSTTGGSLIDCNSNT